MLLAMPLLTSVVKDDAAFTGGQHNPLCEAVYIYCNFLGIAPTASKMTVGQALPVRSDGGFGTVPAQFDLPQSRSDFVDSELR